MWGTGVRLGASGGHGPSKVTRTPRDGEGVSWQEGTRWALWGDILMASGTRLRRHPSLGSQEGGHSWVWGPVEVASAGTTWLWAPDEPFPLPLYPIQNSAPLAAAACVCWGNRVSGTAAVPPCSLCKVDMLPACVPSLAAPSPGLGQCLWGGLAPLKCNQAAPGLLGPCQLSWEMRGGSCSYWVNWV